MVTGVLSFLLGLIAAPVDEGVVVSLPTPCFYDPANPVAIDFPSGPPTTQANTIVQAKQFTAVAQLEKNYAATETRVFLLSVTTLASRPEILFREITPRQIVGNQRVEFPNLVSKTSATGSYYYLVLYMEANGGKSQPGGPLGGPLSPPVVPPVCLSTQVLLQAGGTSTVDIGNSAELVTQPEAEGPPANGDDDSWSCGLVSGADFEFPVLLVGVFMMLLLLRLSRVRSPF